MTRLALLFATTALAACQTDNESPFGTGGSTGNFGDDTGDGEMTDGSPIITDVSGAFTQYTGTWALKVDIYFTDEQDDVDGGNVLLELFVDGELEKAIDSLSIDDNQAVMDDGFVYFALQGDNNTSIDTGVDYDMTIQLQDKAGNKSNTEDLTVEAL